VIERLTQWVSASATAVAGLGAVPYKVFTIAGGVMKIGFKVFVPASAASRGLRCRGGGVVLSLHGWSVAAFVEKHFHVAALVVAALLGFWAVGWFGKAPRVRVGGEA